MENINIRKGSEVAVIQQKNLDTDTSMPGIDPDNQSNSKEILSQSSTIPVIANNKNSHGIKTRKLNFSKSCYAQYFDEIPTSAATTFDSRRKVQCKVMVKGTPSGKCDQTLTLQDNNNTYKNLKSHLEVTKIIMYAIEKIVYRLTT